MFKSTDKKHDRPILWGAPGSLWSGRPRSYLIKKGLEYEEVFASNPRYQREIVPLIGHLVVPVTELENGVLIQDGTDTIAYFEDRYPDNPLIPATPVQKAVAALIGFFGAEMFLIPSLHYRWSFPEQRPFLEAIFGRAFSPHRDMGKQREDVVPIMDFYSGFLDIVGINEETIPVIEQSHKDCLAQLNTHFLHHPYLLGGRPSSADFGMIAPMYAHLSRDPVPSTLMKNSAPHVFRWSERMFEAGITDGEFPDLAPTYLPDDGVPESLIPFLEYLIRDCGPQALGMIATYNTWVADNSELPPGTRIQVDAEAQTSAHPMLGPFDFSLQGVTIHSQAFSNVVHHFQRLLEVIDGLDPEGRASFDALMKSVGGEEFLAARLARPIKSENYQYLLA